jgi:TfoX/Sxy family transcriptional regulator of competence genes
MAYDESLAGRIRDVLADRGDRVREQKMFGGIAFMVDGHMSVGVVSDELMARVGPDGEDDALAQPHARTMDFTGRPMTGFIQVAAAAVATEDDVRAWVDRALAFTTTLPPK